MYQRYRQRGPASRPRCPAWQRRPAGQGAVPCVSPAISSLRVGSLPVTGPLRWRRWPPALCGRRADWRLEQNCFLEAVAFSLASAGSRQGCWENGPPGLSPVPALVVCLPTTTPQQAPCSSIVITHANVSAPETKGGQASGWGFLSTNNIRCKMCTFDKSINIVLLIFFIP